MKGRDDPRGERLALGAVAAVFGFVGALVALEIAVHRGTAEDTGAGVRMVMSPALETPAACRRDAPRPGGGGREGPPCIEEDGRALAAPASAP